MGKTRKNSDYEFETLKKAVEAVKSQELSIYKASKSFKVPYQTIKRYLKKNTVQKYVKETVLSVEDENDLASWIIECQRLGQPRTPGQILVKAGKLAKLSKKSFKNEVPTRRWLEKFLKRHPKISMRTPSMVSRSSANVTKEDILRWHRGVEENLRDMLGDEGFERLKEDSKAWGNLDETGFQLNPKPAKVCAETATPVYLVEAAPPKRDISVMYTFLASGDVLRPQLIFRNGFSKIGSVAQAARGITFD